MKDIAYAALCLLLIPLILAAGVLAVGVIVIGTPIMLAAMLADDLIQRACA